MAKREAVLESKFIACNHLKENTQILNGRIEYCSTRCQISCRTTSQNSTTRVSRDLSDYVRRKIPGSKFESRCKTEGPDENNSWELGYPAAALKQKANLQCAVVGARLQEERSTEVSNFAVPSPRRSRLEHWQHHRRKLGFTENRRHVSRRSGQLGHL